MKKLFQYSEEAFNTFNKAIEEIKKRKCGIREICRKYGVPKTTVHEHLRGKTPKQHRKTEPAPLLTFEGEEKIAEWVINIAKCGFPIKKQKLLETVRKIVEDSDAKKIFKNGIPGEKWYRNFMKRHPEISIRESEGVNKARAIITEAMNRQWFKELNTFLVENDLLDIFDDPERVLNGDETGFALCPKTGKVLAPGGFKHVYNIKLGKEKENITVLVVFNAAGKVCPPLVIFPYVRPPKVVVDSMPEDWVLVKSDTGWMQSSVFFEYVANDFDKWLENNKIKRPVILFIDGHKSHITLELSKICEEKKIVLYALPTNTTHMLQPADVSVFRPLKQEWKNTVKKWQSRLEDVNSTVNKTNFCILLNETLKNTKMKKDIISGFRKFGLYPRDQTKLITRNVFKTKGKTST
ncbi:hypothetical protein NQ314_003309 [Rhamnusium bicolor]|uniref:HTH CENPB-type domain-containing protein n=1 Tax=Rhamnusium bicolor TaxID=1586634 RepID=A0AAV8ZN93_9CUCU|nr:hypothetical protein NQ314_003309 [Rhamnusium bicolor]